MTTSEIPTVRVPLVDVRATLADLPSDLLDICAEVLRSGEYVGGPHVERFEADWAAYCGRQYAVGVGNGTDALELTLRALGMGPGDEVIVPTNTFIATAEAVVNVGATPVFCDVDDDTLLMTAGHAEAVTTPRTAAIIAVHLYGQPCDMDELAAFASKAGLALIEDAAQAHGASWNGRKVGSWGVASCFSFYPTKNLGAAGDAGAVTTNDLQLARRIRTMGNHGRSAGDGNWHVTVGGNSRLDAVQAAVLSVKLPFLDGWIQQRDALVRLYRGRLAGVPQVRLVHHSPLATHAHHLNVVRVPAREPFRELLAARGIASGIHYPVPCHMQPAFAGSSPPLPVAEAAALQLLTLPLFPQLEESCVVAVCDALEETVVAPRSLEVCAAREETVIAPQALSLSLSAGGS